MLKKVWFMFVLCSILMVSGCSGKQKEDAESKVVSEKEISEMDVAEDLEADIDEMDNSDVSMETEQMILQRKQMWSHQLHKYRVKRKHRKHQLPHHL